MAGRREMTLALLVLVHSAFAHPQLSLTNKDVENHKPDVKVVEQKEYVPWAETPEGREILRREEMSLEAQKRLKAVKEEQRRQEREREQLLDERESKPDKYEVTIIRQGSSRSDKKQSQKMMAEEIERINRAASRERRSGDSSSTFRRVIIVPEKSRNDKLMSREDRKKLRELDRQLDENGGRLILKSN